MVRLEGPDWPADGGTDDMEDIAGGEEQQGMVDRKSRTLMPSRD